MIGKRWRSFPNSIARERQQYGMQKVFQENLNQKSVLQREKTLSKRVEHTFMKITINTTNIMANWCNNKVKFNGNQDSLNKVLALFQEMI
jgi:hypothetical protein